MAPSRPPKGRSNKIKKARRSQPNSKPRSPTSTQLLNEATAFLHTGDPEAALPLALRALVLLSQLTPNLDPAAQSDPNSIPAAPARGSLPALNLLAAINLELGDAEAARAYFLQAVDIDPEGEVGEDEGGGAEKFLWLAQLCEEGGEESVRWFERGAGVLRRDIAEAEKKGGDQEDLVEKKKKLAGVLCGIIEVYMTDLSFEPNAEAQCTTLIASALALAPKSPTPHQTQASILISQSDFPAARAALKTSLSLWQHLPASHPDVLDFPSRISLSRLLLEVGMEDEALEVLSDVVEGDESSVEGWYLGGWGLWLLAEKGREAQHEAAESFTGAPPEANYAKTMAGTNANNDDAYDDDRRRNPNANITHDEKEKERITHLRDSRTWLNTCLTLASQLDYEDDRLRDHAQELVQEIERLLLQGGIGLDEEEEKEDEDDEVDDDDDEVEKKGGGWKGMNSSDNDDEKSEEKPRTRKEHQKMKKEEKEKEQKNHNVDVIMTEV